MTHHACERTHIPMASSRTLEPGLWWYGKNNLVAFHLSLKTIGTRHFNGVNDEPHERPSFADILVKLEAISRSPFVTTSHASFRSLQENWRLEIESLFDELRSKEAVSTPVDNATPGQ